MNRSDRPASTSWRAATAHRGHLARGPLSDGLIFDAVRVRLIEIGEAVKDVSSELLDGQPQIPWRQVAAMRDQLAHRYFDTSHAIIEQTVTADLRQLVGAVQMLLDGLDQTERSPRRAGAGGGASGWAISASNPCPDRISSRSKVCHSVTEPAAARPARSPNGGRPAGREKAQSARARADRSQGGGRHAGAGHRILKITCHSPAPHRTFCK